MIHEKECNRVLIGNKTGPITREEIKTAIKQMRNGKAADRDNIAAELLKADMEIAATELEDLFEVIWNTETIPGDWTKGIIVKIPKKGDTTICTTTEE